MASWKSLSASVSCLTSFGQAYLSQLIKETLVRQNATSKTKSIYTLKLTEVRFKWSSVIDFSIFILHLHPFMFHSCCSCGAKPSERHLIVEADTCKSLHFHSTPLLSPLLPCIIWSKYGDVVSSKEYLIKLSSCTLSASQSGLLFGAPTWRDMLDKVQNVNTSCNVPSGGSLGLSLTVFLSHSFW